VEDKVTKVPLRPQAMLDIWDRTKEAGVLIGEYTVHCKKGCKFSRPQAEAGCHLPNSPRPGIIKFFPARESLVSDIPAGDGKSYNPFFTVYTVDSVTQVTPLILLV
jgi:hypothetical protein